MNNKLKQFLQTIYFNPSNILSSANEILIDLPQHSTVELLSFLPDVSNINALRNNLETIYSNDKNYKNNYVKTITTIAKRLENKDNHQFIKEAKNICVELYGQDKIFDDFEAFYNKILINKPIIELPSLVLSAFSATFANDEKNKNLKNLENFIKISITGFKNIKFASKNIAEDCIWNIKSFDENLAIKTQKLFDRILTATSLSYTPNQTDHIHFKATKNEVGSLNYIENLQSVDLIKNDQPVEQNTTIENAIKNFNIDQNSNFISYALAQIEHEIRKAPELTHDNSGLAVLASIIAFLTLCDQYNKEVEDKVLAAFANPMIEINTIFNGKAFEYVTEIALKTCENISNEKSSFNQSSTEITKYDNIFSFNKSPLDKVLTDKKISLALKNAKDCVRDGHYKLVGSPELGKNKKTPKGITQNEQYLMANLNLTSKGKGQAAKALNEVIKTSYNDIKEQAKRLRKIRIDLKNKLENNLATQNEIDKFNEDVQALDAKIESLKTEINHMFVEKLKAENLITEEYANQVEKIF